MKTNLKTVKDYLEVQPKARLRINKNRAIANLILKAYPTLIVPKEKLTDIVGEVLTLDRYWRKCLEENEELRGNDYKDKEVLSQEFQLNLGYNPGHNEDINKNI